MLEWLQNLWTHMKEIDMDQVQEWLQQYSRLGPIRVFCFHL